MGQEAGCLQLRLRSSCGGAGACEPGARSNGGGGGSISNSRKGMWGGEPSAE